MAAAARQLTSRRTVLAGPVKFRKVREPDDCPLLKDFSCGDDASGVNGMVADLYHGREPLAPTVIAMQHASGLVGVSSYHRLPNGDAFLLMLGLSRDYRNFKSARTG
jgi:hypothetical protein